mmetsp:Transcript_33524/g.84150  ORF Transcript_33524/g.84150 Transcript_33524/m.84150 type:complete len:254 (-) Transcript_33524:210-971(-)
MGVVVHSGCDGECGGGPRGGEWGGSWGGGCGGGCGDVAAWGDGSGGGGGGSGGCCGRGGCCATGGSGAKGALCSGRGGLWWQGAQGEGGEEGLCGRRGCHAILDAGCGGGGGGQGEARERGCQRVGCRVGGVCVRRHGCERRACPRQLGPGAHDNCLPWLAGVQRAGVTQLGKGVHFAAPGRGHHHAPRRCGAHFPVQHQPMFLESLFGGHGGGGSVCVCLGGSRDRGSPQDCTRSLHAVRLPCQRVGNSVNE